MGIDKPKRMRGVVIYDELWEKFKKKCDEKATIPSRIIRKSIEEYIKN